MRNGAPHERLRKKPRGMLLGTNAFAERSAFLVCFLCLQCRLAAYKGCPPGIETTSAVALCACFHKGVPLPELNAWRSVLLASHRLWYDIPALRGESVGQKTLMETRRLNSMRVLPGSAALCSHANRYCHAASKRRNI